MPELGRGLDDSKPRRPVDQSASQLCPRPRAACHAAGLDPFTAQPRADSGGKVLMCPVDARSFSDVLYRWTGFLRPENGHPRDSRHSLSALTLNGFSLTPPQPGLISALFSPSLRPARLPLPPTSSPRSPLVDPAFYPTSNSFSTQNPEPGSEPAIHLGKPDSGCQWASIKKRKELPTLSLSTPGYAPPP